MQRKRIEPGVGGAMLHFFTGFHVRAVRCILLYAETISCILKDVNRSSLRMPPKQPARSDAPPSDEASQDIALSTTGELDAKEIIKRMRWGTGTKNDSDLARYLGISSKNVASWRKRNSIPFEIILKCAKLSSRSLDWIVLGDREHKPAPGDSFGVLDHDAIAITLLRLEKEEDADCWGDHWGNIKFKSRVFYSIYKYTAHLLRIAEGVGNIERGSLLKMLKEATEAGDNSPIDALFPEDQRYPD